MTPHLLFVIGLLLAVPILPLRAAEPDAARERILRRFVEELVPLTPGKGAFPESFTLGTSDDGPASEKPALKVALRSPFAMARYEVTQELYQAVMGVNPSKWKGPRNSVEMVSWTEAVDFCRKLTQELRKLKLLGEDEIIRLPSEAEWEYACRAGTTTAYSFGDKVDDLKAHAWYKANSKGEDPPVGKKKPNAWGLYDMHGYIAEWCADAWHPSHEGASADGKPRDKKEEKERVIRGGHWADEADQLRCAARGHMPADHKDDKIGFRCVRAAGK